MGMHEYQGVHPGTLDLMEYKINITWTEVDGPDVRVYCGCKKGCGHITWLYSVVMRADLVLGAVQRSSAAALEALKRGSGEMLGEERALHH